MTEPKGSQPHSPDGEIVVYDVPPPEGAPLEVRLYGDTLWLTQKRMARLFRTSASNVSRHLGNVFDEGELDPSASSTEFSLVRTEGRRRVRRAVTHYNLDAIISVGYRVDSIRTVPFRRWADRVLRNRWRAAAIAETLRPLVARYAETWRLLLEYDEDRLEAPPSVRPASAILHHDLAVAAITAFKTALVARGEASPLFGNAREGVLEGTLDDINRTGSDDANQPTCEEKAANVLYSVVRERPFAEGNNRIGAFLFLLYLRQEGLDHDLDPRALTALPLLAQSAPADKDLVIRLIANLLAAPTA